MPLVISRRPFEDMLHVTRLRLWFLVAVASALPWTSRAFSYYSFGGVGQVYTQTSADGPDFANEYLMNFIATGPPESMYFRSPSGITYFQTKYNPSFYTFGSREALASTFPSGTYSALLQYSATPFGNQTLYTLTGDAGAATTYPPAPHVINGTFENGALIADPNQVSLTLSSWVGRPSGSLVSYVLSGPGSTTGQNLLNQPGENMVFTGLAPDTTYRLDITFFRPDSTVSTTINANTIPPSAFNFSVGGASTTTITVRTVPEPSSLALVVSGMLTAILLRRRH